MTYNEYENNVITLVKKEYKKPICLDTIYKNWKDNISIKEAVKSVITDSIMWNEY